MRIRVHTICGEPLSQRLGEILRTNDITFTTSTGRNFWERATAHTADLVVVEIGLAPAPVDESVVALRNLPGAPEVVVLTEEEHAEERAALLIAGCFAVLNVGLPNETLQETLEALVERRRAMRIDRLHREIEEQPNRLADFASTNPVMRSFMRTVHRVVEPDTSLLILGETGVGKERLARAIHAESPRGGEPFIPVNLAAFPEALLDGELFGHEEGAFTGASGDRRGYFELAHGGTIFLDEIGELPRHLQVKLLRVLQERTIQPLGGEEPMEINVRVMAATNRDLQEEMSSRRFRRDLFYRLSVVTLEIPPLREHAEDVRDLAERYLEEFRLRTGRNVTGFTEAAVEALEGYAWPGNIRELINVVERAVILCEGDRLGVEDLPIGMRGRTTLPDVESPRVRDDGNLLRQTWRDLRDTRLGELERRYLDAHLRSAEGRLHVVSQRTGIKPRTLYLMLQRHGLRRADFKPETSR